VPDAAAINALRPPVVRDVFTLQVTDAHGASTKASLAVTNSARERQADARQRQRRYAD